MKHYALLISCLVGASLGVAQPLNQRVLVVHNAQFPDSLAVAEHYRTVRAIPQANRCAISSPSADTLTAAQFESLVKAPVRACLNQFPAQQILYIVLSYQTPYTVSSNGTLLSIDQQLADVWDVYTKVAYARPAAAHGYYDDSQPQGNVYAPFVSFATYRSSARNPRIYSVWRLDAATPALARGLVDKAVQAETSGLNGIGCIDNRGAVLGSADAGVGRGEWDINVAADFLRQAGFAVTQDLTSPEFGTAPAPLTCSGAAFYAGWYSVNNYNDAFTWAPGAIGLHLDSASAINPRGGTNWSANAIQRGITITAGAVAEPFLAGLPRSAGVFRNLLQGANAGDALLRNTRWLKWMILNIGDPLYTPFPGGRAPFSPNMSSNSFQVAKQSVVFGYKTRGTIRIATPAPTGGLTFTFSGQGAVIVPASVTIPAGGTEVSFDITGNYNAAGVAILRATSPSVQLTNTLTTTPLLTGVAFEDYEVTGGTSVLAAVFLGEPAPMGGAVVTLASNSPAVTVPATVTVPAGMMSAQFSLTTAPVTTRTEVRIDATLNGATQSQTIVLIP